MVVSVPWVYVSPALATNSQAVLPDDRPRIDAVVASEFLAPRTEPAHGTNCARGVEVLRARTPPCCVRGFTETARRDDERLTAADPKSIRGDFIGEQDLRKKATFTILHGDCLEQMRSMAECSIDAIVTDPPYGWRFMGEAWDRFDIEQGARAHIPIDHRKQSARWQSMHAGRYDQSITGTTAFMRWCEEWGREALRVAKPGAHLLAFGGPRTFHRLTSGLQDAGWSIRDCLMWLHGQGFPKSYDVGAGFDKRAGAKREIIGERRGTPHAGMAGLGPSGFRQDGESFPIHGNPVTELAWRWNGWGTALKPAWEPIVLAQRPLNGTYCENLRRWGVGALNIDSVRIPFMSAEDEHESKDKNRHADFGTEPGGNRVYGDFSMVPRRNYDPPGRWPANLLLDEAAATFLDQQTGDRPTSVAASIGTGPNRSSKENGTSEWTYGGQINVAYGDRGGASRFFYVPKASRKERGQGNTHPTVKPIALMRWLVRLVTPPGGTVLDPFAGSGTTGLACKAEGVRCILIEREPKYIDLIRRRLSMDGESHQRAQTA